MRGHSAGLGVNWAAKWSGDLCQSRQGRELRLRPAVYPVGINIEQYLRMCAQKMKQYSANKRIFQW